MKIHLKKDDHFEWDSYYLEVNLDGVALPKSWYKTKVHTQWLDEHFIEPFGFVKKVPWQCWSDEIWTVWIEPNEIVLKWLEGE